MVPTFVVSLGPRRREPRRRKRAPVNDVAHGGVGDGDVFKQRAIDRLESVALAAFEDAVGDGDVDEAAVGFGAALDAAVVPRRVVGGRTS